MTKSIWTSEHAWQNESEDWGKTNCQIYLSKKCQSGLRIPLKIRTLKSHETAETGPGCVNLVSDVPHSSRRPLLPLDMQCRKRRHSRRF